MVLQSFHIYNFVSSLIHYVPEEANTTEGTTEGFSVDFVETTPTHIITNNNGVEGLIPSINKFLASYTELAVGIFGIISLTLMAVAMVNFFSLGASSNNPQARKGAMTKILLTGISSALLGSLGLVIAIVYNIFD